MSLAIIGFMKDPLILTLDAGGTNFYFSAMKRAEVVEGSGFSLPSHAHDLDLCLATLKEGFHRLIEAQSEQPAALSFAFPGPADYTNGVIGDLPNLPAFRGGVPLGPILEDAFGIPVYIRNDGDLFCYGESRSGFLPWINEQLEVAGNPKRYQNLIGITLGTGFGTGICIKGNILEGDTGTAAEGWKLRNLRHPYSSVEDCLSIQALKRMYAEQIALDPAKAPDPEEICRIAKNEAEGVQPAAREAYLRYGSVLGEALAEMLTLIDGLVVIGGGLSGAYKVFSGAMMDQLNGHFDQLNGEHPSRLIQKMYNAEHAVELNRFVQNDSESATWGEQNVSYSYHPVKKLAVGLTRLGTEKAIMAGAYHYACSRIRENAE